MGRNDSVPGMMRLMLASILLVPTPGTPAQAFDLPVDEMAAQFVASNMVSTFYHELGHAMIDVLGLPVLGREEDAADTLSTLLIHSVWEEDSAVAMVYDTANAFLMYAAEAETTGAEIAYWGEHSLDMQRYYNLVCLFYGANPDERGDIARELELPEDRAERCPEEFLLAEESWGRLLADLAPGPRSKGLRMMDADPDDPLVALIAEEVTALNQVYGFPVWIDVRVEPCGEANAFYDPWESTITMCTEYAEDLLRIWLINK